ncbi:endonuclease [Novosphingobium umbonatum]|uniref:Endonuclease n=1 Tax=Novosphingobium umbonatum TaxID=1908524 RepID=A0A3S2YBY0_9SPHN|nr:S1/P1 nuclease [Novosphingobium umbonatum]RVU07074.1 endonuclease [Novosphingobium umbonatum]
MISQQLRRLSASPLRSVLSAVAALAVGWASPALAWGETGHKTIANIALANVSPKAQAQVAALMKAESGLGTPNCPVKDIADASVWPDCMRAQGWRWGYTFPWHFHDSDVTGSGFDMKANCSYGNCVTAQIPRAKRILADASLPAAQRLEALAFLVHFVGDLHQPLHAAEHAHDAGGNGVIVGNIAGEPYIINTTPPTVVSAKPTPLTLHWMWDNYIVERARKAGKLPAVRAYSPAEKAGLATGEVPDWAQESWKLAHDVVYPQVFGKVVGPEDKTPKEVTVSEADLDKDVPLASDRLLRAGLRLARLMEEALGS